jgi:hypothetical protein
VLILYLAIDPKFSATNHYNSAAAFLTLIFPPVYNEEQLRAAATTGKCVAVFKTPEVNDGGYRPGRRMGSYAQLPPKRIPLPYLAPLPDSASNAPINNVIYDDDDLYM